MAKGYSQVWGVNFFRTFSPNAKLISLRLFIAISAFYSLEVIQADAVAAFMQAILPEKMFIDLPEGFKGPRVDPVTRRKMVLELFKSIPGLKQGGFEWNQLLDKRPAVKRIQTPED